MTFTHASSEYDACEFFMHIPFNIHLKSGEKEVYLCIMNSKHG